VKWTELYHKVNDASSREPNITDVLNDPVVRAVMHADGVDPDELARILGFPIRDQSSMQQLIVGSVSEEHRTIRNNSCGDLNALDVEFDDYLRAGAFAAHERLGADSVIELVIERTAGSTDQPAVGPHLHDSVDGRG
jgi:hypothetical protein